MEFSLSFGAQLINPTPQREHELLRGTLDQCVYAEEKGFDRVWTVEHHATKWYSHMSAPEVFLSAVAARTSRIRIGHGVVCMPFNYNFPTRVCERAAMLDIISGGRLDLGAGRGGMPQELALCNVDSKRTYGEVEEALRIIGKAWLTEGFEWEGKLLTIKAPEGNPPLNILPRPVQWPHPPLFLACTRPETVEIAGRYGVGAMVMGFGGPDSVAELRRSYDEAARTRKPGDQVATVINHHFSVACPTVVSDDREAARQMGARGQRFFGESVKHWSSGTPEPNEHTEHEDNYAFMQRAKQEMLDRYDRGDVPPAFHNERSLFASAFNVDHAYGDWRDAVAHVEKLEAAGAEEVKCLTQYATLTFEQRMETIRQWGDKVIPHFRSVGAKGEKRRAAVV
ncbi:LLM class flavin-dependent oxidoreductase [Phenylobacterium sp.]|jgi:alkanesulfonate monooxygenase SsuD/methylene tetrahydromethanopterin reductase-like flavin-dependent oxidoreductase (luciferase family)|uniref:LLM class flavin-dependent oxidoreductase n=1 Tax=Phenylobacterium sp. TaxID=1871053 RepID=UPI002F4169DE